jgi:hypothetical protein
MFHALLSFPVKLIEFCRYYFLAVIGFCHAYHLLQESMMEDIFLQRLVVPEGTPRYFSIQSA